MRRRLNEENKKLIPLRRLTEISSYSAAYISILVQRKKLKAKRIGRNFFTTKEWFNEYLESHARNEKRNQSFSEQKETPLHPALKQAGQAPLVKGGEETPLTPLYKGGEETPLTPLYKGGKKEKSLPEILAEAITEEEQIKEEQIILADEIEPEEKLKQAWQKQWQKEIRQTRSELKETAQIDEQLAKLAQLEQKQKELALKKAQTVEFKKQQQIARQIRRQEFIAQIAKYFREAKQSLANFSVTIFQVSKSAWSIVFNIRQRVKRFLIISAKQFINLLLIFSSKAV